MLFLRQTDFRGIRPAKRGGFTLLELVLAMGMVAMLSLTLFTCFTVASKAKRVADATIAPVRAAGAALDIIAADLEQCPNPAGSTSNANPIVQAFEGAHAGGGASAADTLEYYTQGSDPTEDGSGLSDCVRRIDLTLRTDVSPPVLVRQVTRNVLGDVQEAPPEEILCHNVKSFGLRYFDGSEWSDDWDSTAQANNLPNCVQIDLVVSLKSPTNPNAAPVDYHVSRVITLPMAPS